MTAFEAKRKAKYGKYNHIYWTDRSGNPQADRLTADSLKRAMLDTGTRGYIVCYGRQYSQLANWSICCLWLRLLKKGHYYHD